MQIWNLGGIDYCMKAEIDLVILGVVSYLAYTPTEEFAIYLVDKIKVCFDVDHNDAKDLCSATGFAHDFTCSGFDGNTEIKKKRDPIVQEDTTSEA